MMGIRLVTFNHGDNATLGDLTRAFQGLPAGSVCLNHIRLDDKDYLIMQSDDWPDLPADTLIADLVIHDEPVPDAITS